MKILSDWIRKMLRILNRLTQEPRNLTSWMNAKFLRTLDILRKEQSTLLDIRKKSKFMSFMMSKNNGRHQARVIANDQLTPEPINELVYSGVVTLRGMTTVMFLVELNGLKLWNIQSAYLNAYTTEPVLIVS